MDSVFCKIVAGEIPSKNSLSEPKIKEVISTASSLILRFGASSLIRSSMNERYFFS